MPYWCRRRELEKTLESYDRLYRGLDLEVCIADDGSPGPYLTDDEWDFWFPVRIEHLAQKDQAKNPCVPMNRALEMASGEVMCITNPEVYHTEDVISPMLAELTSVERYVTAACLNNGEEWVAHSEMPANGRLPRPEGSQFHFFAMMLRPLWQASGGFDEDYRHGQGCEDNDWLWRLDSIGAVFVHRDDLVVQHYRTPVRWSGNLKTNKDLLRSKWGHRWSSRS